MFKCIKYRDISQYVHLHLRVHENDPENKSSLRTLLQYVGLPKPNGLIQRITYQDVAHQRISRIF